MRHNCYLARIWTSFRRLTKCDIYATYATPITQNGPLCCLISESLSVTLSKRSFSSILLQLMNLGRVLSCVSRKGSRAQLANCKVSVFIVQINLILLSIFGQSLTFTRLSTQILLGLFSLIIRRILKLILAFKPFKLNFLLIFLEICVCVVDNI